MSTTKTSSATTSTKEVNRFFLATVRKGKTTEKSFPSYMELLAFCQTVLTAGKQFEHEEGRAKINMNPKNVESLEKMLNLAANNSAKNGSSSTSYEVWEEEEPIHMAKKESSPKGKKEVVKEIATKKETSPKGKKEEKPSKEEKTKSTIGSLVKGLILEGKTTDEILITVAEVFPLAKTTRGCVSWYRSNLKK